MRHTVTLMTDGSPVSVPFVGFGRRLGDLRMIWWCPFPPDVVLKKYREAVANENEVMHVRH